MKKSILEKLERLSERLAEIDGLLGGEKVLLLKPQTYMNESGRAVGEAMRFFDIDPSQVIVLYDELDLEPGKVRVKLGGGAAGHNGIRSMMRQDPDVILVGELRDLETIRLALTAAETGHLVLASLHTRSAPATIDRMVDVFDAHEKALVRTQLSEALVGVLSQTLCPTASGIGRAAVFETLVATPAIRHLIREGKTPQMHSVLQTGAAVGMQTLQQALDQARAQGRIV